MNEEQTDDEIFERLCASIDQVVLISHRSWVEKGMKKQIAVRLVQELEAAKLCAKILEGRAVE